ncbi:MAG: hypothetical protein DMG67_01960 [Acidobacteria bacterium]|nr:MAG: hypothetical protein DMG67_01960 [Acidobacteriota bacterium]
MFHFKILNGIQRLASDFCELHGQFCAEREESCAAPLGLISFSCLPTAPLSLRGGLAVESQEVVLFKTRAADRWSMVDEDIDASYQELKSLGANIVDPLEKKPWGLRQFTVKDLDGNLFYFHHD